MTVATHRLAGTAWPGGVRGGAGIAAACAWLLVIPPAWCFERAALTPDKVLLGVSRGVSREFALAAYDGGSEFSGLRLSPDRRYAGWTVLERAVPSQAPLPLTVVVAGPTTELRIVGTQAIRRWDFEKRGVRVCFGPTHGAQSQTCRGFALPE